MLSHDLARLLLDGPNLPVATFANNHTYMSRTDTRIGGSTMIGILESYSGQHIIIGNFRDRNINKPNWYVSCMLHGNIL